MFRDFIYLDIDRIQSILAQLQQGLLSELMEEKTEEVKGRATAAVNLLAMLLPVNLSGSVEQGRGTSIGESRVLHDYAFEQARLTLEGEGLLTEEDDLDRDEVPEDGFVLVRGAAEILDYETLRHIAGNFDKIDDFFHSDDSPAQRKNVTRRPSHSGNPRTYSTPSSRTQSVCESPTHEAAGSSGR